MTDKRTPDWMKKQEKERSDPDFEGRRKQFLAELPKLLERQHGRERAKSYYPYLLVRSVLGDRGDRPINVPFWESPDIWTAPGSPATTPAVPASHGGTVTVGRPNTVYAHVWNLGFAPLAGVLVEFSWFNPSLAITGANAHLIGRARCELAGRGMQGSHLLVKCPTPWVPVMENGGHECLVVRVSGIGDPVGGNEWAPWLNRHVGQRNVSVIAAQASSAKLIDSLNESRLGRGHLQLIQLGADQGAFAARIVAPGKRIPPSVKTHLLSELTSDNRVVLEQPARPPAGMLAPFHALTDGGAPTAPKLTRIARTSVVDPRVALGDLPQQRGAASPTGVTALLASVKDLHTGAKAVRKPTAGQVHVLRLANYDEKGQLIGGYTLVLPGR